MSHPAPEDLPLSPSWKTWKIPNTTLSVVGYSRAADKTAFWIPELKWFLDAGSMASTTHRPERVFLTHVHSDHSYNLPNLVSSRHQTDIYAPEESVKLVENFIFASQYLNSHCSAETPGFHPPKMTIHPVKENDSFTIGKKSEYTVRVVKCFHPVPCVGYIFYQNKHKIKPEYAALKGPEIAKLRKEGVEIQMKVESPMFAFIGDTSVEIFEVDSLFKDQLASIPVMFIECTSIQSDVSEAEARERGHVHWSSLEPHVQNNPQTQFVLIHFSVRYKNDVLASFFDEITQKYPNVVPWI